MFLLELPILRQTYDWDCGAKALQTILVYYGIEVDEASIMKIADTQPDPGTTVKNMEHAIAYYGLDYESRTMDIDDLIVFLHDGVPVLLLLQAWNGRKGVNYHDDFDDGHRVVVIGYTQDYLMFEDPYSFHRVTLTQSELIQRRHSQEGSKKFFQHGIAVHGKNPSYQSHHIQHME